jgi:hypothetical protein
MTELSASTLSQLPPKVAAPPDSANGVPIGVLGLVGGALKASN